MVSGAIMALFSLVLLVLYVSVNNFSVMSGRVFLGEALLSSI